MPPADTTAFVTTVWFMPLLIATLLGIGGLLTVVSGWRELAARFPAPVLADGERHHFVSAKFARVPWFPVNYGGFLIVTIAPAGLSVGTFRPLHLLWPAFFVPWAQVESVQEQATALSRRTVVRVRGSSVSLALRGGVGQRVLAMFNQVGTT